MGKVNFALVDRVGETGKIQVQAERQVKSKRLAYPFKIS